MDHEEWRVAGGPVGGRPQAPEHCGKIRDPSSDKPVHSVKDPRLEALLEHSIRALNLPVHAGVRHGGPIDMDVVFIIELEELFFSELRDVVRDNGV